jgi:DNA helicase-2/ATP-dependent DNA helicase PcrA
MEATALAAQLDSEFRTHCARFDRDEPWFGHFALRGAGKLFAYKIGPERHPDERIVDWRHPLARAYYDARPGEQFELESPAYAKLSGVVDCHAAVTARSRALRRLDVSTETGTVSVVASESGFAVPAERSRAKDPETGLPDILALITREQYRLITASRERPVIIQGRAGSGKTTVALYRVAWLAYPDGEEGAPPVDPARVLIVMFNKALSTFVRNGLAALKLDAAKLDTFHGWALEEIRRAYRGTIQPDARERAGRDVASSLKKQIGILGALEAFVAEQTQHLEAWLAEKLAPYKAGSWLERFKKLDRPVVRRLVELRTTALNERDAASGAQQKRLIAVYEIFDTAIRRMTQYKEELLRLLTKKELLAKHVTASPTDLDTLARYQGELQSEGGTERRPGPQVAFEDFALLLRLIQLKNGGFPDKDHDDEVHIYDHLVIDEAQDFGAIELAVLLSAVRAPTGVTIVGDVNQKIIPDADFIGWDQLAKELGIAGASVAKLEVAHRATLPIMRVADTIIGDTTDTGRAGPMPTLTITESASATLDRVAELVRASTEEDRNGHVCVVCKSTGEARDVRENLAALLRDTELPVRLGHNKEFEFGRGVTVTNMRQIKGLEFDTVIVLEPSDANYPVDTQGRRWLYTVATRAKDQLHFVCTREPGALLREALDRKLLDLLDRSEVPPVTFGQEDEQPF